MTSAHIDGTAGHTQECLLAKGSPCICDHSDGLESWPCYACGRRYPTQQEAHDCEHNDGEA